MLYRMHLTILRQCRIMCLLQKAHTRNRLQLLNPFKGGQGQSGAPSECFRLAVNLKYNADSHPMPQCSSFAPQNPNALQHCPLGQHVPLPHILNG